MFREKFTDEDEISLNMLRVQKYMNNTRMEELARDNMPFMGLDIHGLQELTLKPVSCKNQQLDLLGRIPTLHFSESTSHCQHDSTRNGNKDYR